jgi:hypothetical protein
MLPYTRGHCISNLHFKQQFTFWIIFYITLWKKSNNTLSNRVELDPTTRKSCIIFNLPMPSAEYTRTMHVLCYLEYTRVLRQCNASSILACHTLRAELSRLMCHAHYVLCRVQLHATHITCSVECYSHATQMCCVAYTSVPRTLYAVSNKLTFHEHYVLHGTHLQHAGKM